MKKERKWEDCLFSEALWAVSAGQDRLPESARLLAAKKPRDGVKGRGRVYSQSDWIALVAE